jgi:hypothetical protein
MTLCNKLYVPGATHGHVFFHPDLYIELNIPQAPEFVRVYHIDP